MRTSGPLKVCLAASAGGHLSQLRKVAKGWSGYALFWITTSPVVGRALAGTGRVYVVGECNREHLLGVFGVFFRCIRILMKERPDVVVSTGAAPGCLMCLCGRLLGARIVWLDSVTNVDRLSLSGRLVRPFADLLLVQWPDLVKQYPGAEYVGAVV